MRNIRFTILLGAVAFCLLFSLTFLFGGDQIGAAAAQGKTRPGPSPRASVTIDSGFDISADGLGTYVDGQNGVNAEIWAGGSEDFTLNLNNSKRYFNVKHTKEGCGGSTCSQIGDDTYNSGWYIDIRQIGNMALGETRWTRAQVQVRASRTQSLLFVWCGSVTPVYDQDGNQIWPPAGVSLLQTGNTCSGSNFLVSATCTGFNGYCTDWTVSTSDSTFDPNADYVSPISGIMQSSGAGWYGLYRTGFNLTIHRN